MEMYQTTIPDQNCSYCYPAKPNHKKEKINSLFHWMIKPIKVACKMLSLGEISHNYLILCLKFLLKTKKIDISKTINRDKMLTRLQLLWDEAHKQELDLYIFQTQRVQLHAYLLQHQNRKHYFLFSPTTLLNKYKKYKNPTIFDHKQYFKKTLKKHNLPIAEGKTFFLKKRALRYARSIGYPLVVKPEASSLMHHVSTHIHSEHALSHAFDIAKMIDFKIIVEKFIEGNVHRVICIGERFIACTKRTRASIVGNGQSTVDELIDQFNKHPYRGNPGSTGFGIYQVNKNSSFTRQCLLDQNVCLNTVLEKNKQLYLSHKSTCGTGAEVINVTKQVCQENIQIFLKVHQVLNCGISAIDLICQDVSTPWHLQNWAFLENNSFPAIDMHHYPSIGESINVAKEIWDFILQELS